MSSPATCRNGAAFGRRAELTLPFDQSTDPLSRDLTSTVRAQTGTSPVEQRPQVGSDSGWGAS